MDICLSKQDVSAAAASDDAPLHGHSQTLQLARYLNKRSKLSVDNDGMIYRMSLTRHTPMHCRADGCAMLHDW